MKQYLLIPFLIVMSPSLYASFSENSHDDLEELRSALTDIDLSKFTLHDGNETPPSPPPSHGRLHRELSQKTIEELDTVQTAAGLYPGLIKAGQELVLAGQASGQQSDYRKAESQFRLALRIIIEDLSGNETIEEKKRKVTFSAISTEMQKGEVTELPLFHIFKGLIETTENQGKQKIIAKLISITFNGEPFCSLLSAACQRKLILAIEQFVASRDIIHLDFLQEMQDLKKQELAHIYPTTSIIQHPVVNQKKE